MTETPRYLRFARALALCSSLAALPGCPSSSGSDAGGTDTPSTSDTPALADAPSTEDAPSSEDAPSTEDAPALADAPVEDAGDCSTCDCGFSGIDAGLPLCDSVGLILCCAAVGPLAPPELPA